MSVYEHFAQQIVLVNQSKLGEEEKIVEIKMQNYDKRVIQANCWIYDSKNLNLVRKEILVSGGGRPNT